MDKIADQYPHKYLNKKSNGSKTSRFGFINATYSKKAYKSQRYSLKLPVAVYHRQKNIHVRSKLDVGTSIGFSLPSKGD